MATPTTAGATENTETQVGPAKKTKRRRPLSEKAPKATPFKWCQQKAGLPADALAFARANAKRRANWADAATGAAQQPMPPPAPAEQQDNTTAPPPKRRKHEVLFEHLPNLPEEFTFGTDRIGVTELTENGRPVRPLVNIVSFGPKEDIFSSVTRAPAGDDGKVIRYGNKYTPAQKMRAADYSKKHGYDSKEGAPAHSKHQMHLTRTKYQLTTPATSVCRRTRLPSSGAGRAQRQVDVAQHRAHARARLREDHRGVEEEQQVDLATAASTYASTTRA